MTLVIIDAWTYRREVDSSRIRLAAAAVGYVLGPEVWVEIRDGEVLAVLRRPWWAPLVIGAWDLWARRRAVARCKIWVPKICGWCPMVKVATA